MAEENAKVETPKTEKPKVEAKSSLLKISDVFRKVAVKGTKNQEDMAKQIMAEFTKAGQTTNCKGKPLEETKVKNQIKAMLKDIKQERKGWWKTYTINETETELKIVLKPVAPV